MEYLNVRQMLEPLVALKMIDDIFKRKEHVAVAAGRGAQPFAEGPGYVLVEVN